MGRQLVLEPTAFLAALPQVIPPPPPPPTGSIAPPTTEWQPALLKATDAGTQVGPNGQYSQHPIALASLISQTSAGFASGDITLTAANQTYVGIIFTGKVTNHTSGVKFYSCEFRGNSSTPGALVDCTATSAGEIEFFDSYFNPSVKNANDAILGGSYTAWRCDVWRTTDGFGAYNHTGQTNCSVYLYNNYVHDLCANLTDGGQKKGSAQSSPGPSHNDCCQYQGGNFFEMIGNSFMAYVDMTFGDGASWNAGTATTSITDGREFGPNYQCNSCLQTNQNNGQPITTGVKINFNNFGGGTIAVNFAWNSLNTEVVIDEFMGNLWVDQNQGGPYTATMGTSSSQAAEGTSGHAKILSATNNVYFDGTPINLRVDHTNTPTFTEFAPGAACPVGALDITRGEALPAGVAAIRNVGVRPGVRLTPFVGNLVLTSGQVVSGLDIYGSVTTAGTLAVPPTVTDCKIRGVAGTTADAGLALGHNYDLSGTVFKFCTFDGTGQESGFLNGLSGGHFTVKYCEMQRVVDGLHITGQGGGVTAWCNRFYHGYYESTWNDAANANRTTAFTDHAGRSWVPPYADQSSSGDVHGDGCQMAGSSGHSIRGNYFGGANPAGLANNEAHLDPTVAADYADIQTWGNALCFKNSGMILNALDGNHIGALVELNWFQGGAACVNLGHVGQTVDFGAGVTFQNNIIVRAGSTGQPLFVNSGWAGVVSGTTFDDGSPVSIVNY